MTLNCWIVDDEPLALSLLESYVNNTPFLKLTGKFSSAKAAMKEMENQTPDVIFLDIQMPYINGLEFAQIINESTKIIFTTAFKDYAIDGYKVNAIDYLLKPFSYANFLTAAKKALTWHETVQPKDNSMSKKEDAVEGIFVKADYKIIHVLFEDIIYVEGLKNYIKIFTEKRPKPIITLMTMVNMEKALPADYFIRIHRSFIVKKNKIGSINKNRLTVNGKEIPIGKTYRQNFMKEIENANNRFVSQKNKPQNHTSRDR
ncbi:LytR/AlgR family response regulator transcription factor [Anaerorudis cellulosivorans]|uniref:LytR/AlgR family response regulator transcription factor n=1 Tax=Anaerorudis cellulosivorans TaxID=3397862 RepID=UPI00221EA836|nr:LytTR family DNA-binding domain-containing protein [Seramator thermalis]MCW1735823.1 LytTR family DNA-binding domain-containing protein [Seramator thermalis]